MPASIHSAATSSDASSHRKNVASPPALRQPERLHRGQDHVALRPVAGADVVYVGVVVPGCDRRPLEEFGRRDADVRAVLRQRRDDLRVPRDEPRAVAGHRRPLRERVEYNHVRAFHEPAARTPGHRRRTPPSRPRRRPVRTRVRAPAPLPARRTPAGRSRPWGCSGSSARGSTRDPSRCPRATAAGVLLAQSGARSPVCRRTPRRGRRPARRASARRLTRRRTRSRVRTPPP